MRIPILALFFAAISAPALAWPCHGKPPAKGIVFAGEAFYVGDGDGVCVGDRRHPALAVQVRLADFYAPELNEVGGRAAKAALERLVLGRQLRCVADHRSYDRSVAWCTIDGRRLGDGLRAAGVAEGGRGYLPTPR